MALTKVSTPAIKDEAITLAKLLHGDSNSNGKFLRANNGADPSFETIDLTALSASNLTSGTLPDARFPATLPAVSAANLTNIPAANITGTLPAIDGSNLTGINTDLVSDTSPQLGGDLATNSNDIVFADADKAIFGAGTDLQIFSDGSTCFLKADDLRIRSAGNENYQTFAANGAVKSFYDNSVKFETTNTGAKVTGKLDFTGSGHLNGVNLGASQQLNLYHDTNDAYFDNNVGDFYVRNDGSSTTEKVRIQAKGGEQSIVCTPNDAVDLYHDNSRKFETTSYGTKVTGYQAATSYVGFHVKVTGNNNGFGENHGSGITTYDTNYYSPIPMFNSRTVGFGNSYLQFPSYASGEYIKFTAPVQGLYHFSLSCSWETHHGGDWLVVGWERNMTSNSNNGVFQNNGVGVSGVFERSSVDSGGPSTLTTVIWLDVNDTAVLYQQSSQAVRWKSNEAFVRGYLI